MTIKIMASTTLATYLHHTATNGGNVSLIDNNICGSNSSIWLLKSPICSTKYESIVSFILVALFLCLVTFITIVGNVLVLVSLYRFKKLRSMSNCLIGNLAVSDLLLALSVLPVSTTYDLLGYWVFGEITCTVWLCIDVLYCTASIWGLCTIAVDRYTATVYPVWYLEKKSPTRALVYIIFVWLFSIIVSVAPFIGWREMIPSFYQNNEVTNRQECVLFMSKTYVVYSAMGSFVIPTCLMVFLYVRIFIVLKKRTRSMQPIRKRVLYLSVSDIESEAQALDKQDNNDRIDVVLKVASTQTAPLTTDVDKNINVENSAKSKSTNGIVAKDEINMQYVPNILIDLLESASQVEQDRVLKCTGLIFEANERTKSAASSKNAIGCKHSNLKVNYYQDVQTNGESQCDVSIKSNTINEESSDVECDGKYSRSPQASKGMFVPWNRDNSGNMSVKHKHELRERRATKRMAMIMACFCFCWWPFLFMYTVRSFCENCPIDIHFQSAIIWLGYANSSLNPILYTIFNEDFRKAFHKIVTCKTDVRR